MKEIDILNLVNKILNHKKSLIISMTIGIVIGVIIAVSTPKTYTSEVILAPEMNSGGLALSDNLTEMASNFGIDVSPTGKTIDAIYPEIYPEILSSYDFISTLFPIKVRLKNNPQTRTYYNHILHEEKIPFWNYPKMWLASKLMPKEESNIKNAKNTQDPFQVSKVDMGISKSISDNISCLIDKKTSVILISVTDQDPLVAAIVADTIQSRLQLYITDYRTKKAKNDLHYYTKLYNDSKNKYLNAQKTYASFCDANQDVVLESFQVKRDELENNMQMAFNLMSQMQTQMQSARAKVQERTPAYTMIQSPKMAYQASSMSRSMIVFITLFLAIIANGCWTLFLKDFIASRKKKGAPNTENTTDTNN